MNHSDSYPDKKERIRRSVGDAAAINICGVTFDMDGLMFNTEDLYDDVTSIVLDRRGKKYSADLKLKIMGMPGPQAFEIMNQALDLDESFAVFQAEMEEVFADILPQQIAKMHGLDPLLDLLESLQIPKGVATSSTRKFAQTALGIFQLEPRFEFLLTGDDVTHGKPHPEIYLTAANLLGIRPNQMLALEDSYNGSQAAVAAGAITVAIPTAHSRDQCFRHTFLVAESLADPLLWRLLK